MLWYRNNKDEWITWSNFKRCFRQNFIPYQTIFELEDEISQRKQRNQRKQKVTETVKEYETEIRTLMRKHGQMSPLTQLKRIYDMRPEY